MIRLLAYLAHLEIRQAEVDKAIEHAQEALDIAEQFQDFGLMVICLEVLGMALWRANRWQEVLQVNRRRQAINRARGDKYSVMRDPEKAYTCSIPMAQSYYPQGPGNVVHIFTKNYIDLCLNI
jgi:hypothetical protein